jgi:hypothetical protein
MASTLIVTTSMNSPSSSFAPTCARPVATKKSIASFE